ncbi:MAG TPA: tetratricopeptide repeat protein [Pseudonocardiaceae bacterium]
MVSYPALAHPEIPRQLLSPPVSFVNRANELRQLDYIVAHSAQQQSPAVVLLRGPGGVGKTALATRWSNQVAERFPDGQLYTKLTTTNGEPLAPGDVLGDFLRSLGVPAQDLPTGLAERASRFRSVTSQRSVMLMLDDAASAAQVRALLPGPGRNVVVVTSRRPLVGVLVAGAHLVHVDPLDRDSALRLLGARVGTDRLATEREPAERLARLCGGLPLALCVVGALAAARPHRSLARTARDLRDEHRRLAALSVDDTSSLRSTFDMSYLDLTAHAARAYRLLGLHPGGGFQVELVAAMMSTDIDQAQDAIDELLDGSLLDEVSEDRYQFHDLIRVHARELVEERDGEQVRLNALRRITEWYLMAARTAGHAVAPARRVRPYAFVTPTDELPMPPDLNREQPALDWLSRERLTLQSLVRSAADLNWHELACQLAYALQPLYILHKHYWDAIETYEIALRAASEWGDPAAQDSMRKRLARGYARLGEFDHATRHATEMLAATRQRADRRAEAKALKSLALIYRQAGDPGRAATVFEQTLDIMRESASRRSQALILVDLGETLTDLERLDDADRYLDEAFRLLSTLNPPDRYNAARAAVGLARVRIRLGDHVRAERLLRDALSTMTEANSAYERSRALLVMAELSECSGNTQDAARHRAEAERLSHTPGLALASPIDTGD